MKNLTPTLVVAALLSVISHVHAQAVDVELVGSRESVRRQHGHAVNRGYTFTSTPAQIRELIDQGRLLKVVPTSHLRIHNVSFPYLQVSVKTLLQRLSVQYFNACGEQLVATSMTRPTNQQPANAARDSVHPTGMAFDLRIPSKQNCRSWLESTLLSLEEREVLDVTRERRPPHYHVAVFPEPYEVYLASITGRSHQYIVARGDTLSAIASRSGVTVAQIKVANGLRGDLINIGQHLTIPATSASVAANTPEVREITHKVQAGDTLWRIATRYSTSVDILRADNDLAGDLLRVGQVLRVVMDGS